MLPADPYFLSKLGCNGNTAIYSSYLLILDSHFVTAKSIYEEKNRTEL